MVDELCKEMSFVHDLLASQVKASMQESDVKESMCRSWVQRIQQQKTLKDDAKAALTIAVVGMMGKKVAREHSARERHRYQKKEK